MTTEAHVITDNLDELLGVLPEHLGDAIPLDERADLIELVLDLGRRPEARYVDRFEYLRETAVTREDLAWVEARLGTFGDDNRAGIPATLHRISAMRNRRGQVVGLTLRVGRAVTGIVDILRDIIESGQSVLLMGRPGLGKTTLLREMARVMADEVGKRVVIVDTSNEIAGDGDVPHPAIGRARRMQVARVSQQHDVMIEAVENHMPEVVVIDEIGRVEEALAARTIAERGVQLIATVHGNTLDNLLANPTLSDLIGGIGAVTLSDEEARRRRTQKTVLERKAPPTFDVVVEMIERDKIAVRVPVAEVVDALLRGADAPPELRWRDANGEVQRAQMAPAEREETGHDWEMRGFGNPRPDRRQSDRRERPERGDKFARKERPSRYGERLSSERLGTERPGRHERHPFHDELEAEGRGASTPTEDSNGFRHRWDSADAQAHSDLLTVESEDRDGVQAGEAISREHEAAREAADARSEAEAEEFEATLFLDVPADITRVRRLYPFGVSRSRLARAIKHLGVPLSVARTWKEADAVLMLSGEEGLPATSSLLREAREMGLPLIGVRGGAYAEVLSRLNDVFSVGENNNGLSPKDVAVQEARNAVQRVLAEAEPVELRPQAKTLRKLQHQLAERYHLRSYSVGREPHRRVRFLPTPGR